MISSISLVIIQAPELHHRGKKETVPPKSFQTWMRKVTPKRKMHSSISLVIQALQLHHIKETRNYSVSQNPCRLDWEKV